LVKNATSITKESVIKIAVGIDPFNVPMGYVGGDMKMEDVCPCASAAILNHELFLWVNQAAELMEKWESGALSNEDFLKKLKLQNEGDLIGKRYRSVFWFDSSIGTAHYKALGSLESGFIENPTTEKDFTNNQKVYDQIEEYFGMMVEEQDQTAAAYGTSKSRAEQTQKHKDKMAKKQKKFKKKFLKKK
jgi:hypothetical protein